MKTYPYTMPTGQKFRVERVDAHTWDVFLLTVDASGPFEKEYPSAVDDCDTEIAAVEAWKSYVQTRMDLGVW